MCNKVNTIIDISILHNKVIYSLDSYSKFPDFLKYTNLMYEDGKIKPWKQKQPDPTKFLRTMIEKDKKKNLKVVSLIAARHRDKYF